MTKLNPAVRTGLIWAGVHQAFALLTTLLVYTAPSAAKLSGFALALADSPALILLACLGYSNWHPEIPIALPPAAPLLSQSDTVMLLVAIILFGPIQWFLIGHAVGVKRSRREAPKLSQ